MRARNKLGWNKANERGMGNKTNGGSTGHECPEHEPATEALTSPGQLRTNNELL